jgi:SAM-dependent methyltransferase
MLDAIDDLERRVREQERLQLESVTEDLLAGLESLRSQLADAEEVTSGARALPYVAPGTLEQFRAPKAGVVFGYRDGSATEPGYRGFEQAFRGPEERVRERQKVFLDLIDGHAPVLDAGCGRGEFLELLRERGVTAVGVDSDADMVERCREKGLDNVELASAGDYLERQPDASLGAIFSAQVIEHMPYDELRRFLELARAKLRSGGLLVAETVNPHAPHALKTFWVDPTHRHPVFPEVALVLCKLAGFASAYVFHPLGVGHVEDDRYRESEYAVVAESA